MVIKMSHVFIDAFSSLKKNKINVCLMRDDPKLIEHVCEIDILINPCDKRTSLAVLDNLGWEILDIGIFIPHKISLFVYDNGIFYKLDVHYKVIDYSIIYMDNESFFNDAICTKFPFTIPSNECFFLHIIIHTILGKTKLGNKYIHRIEKIVRDGFDKKWVFQQAKKYGIFDLLRDCLTNPIAILSSPQKIAKLKRKIKIRLLMANPRNLIRFSFNFLFRYFAIIIGLRRGFSIALIGPDGAGKTTFSNALQSCLHHLEIPSRIVYMGPWEYPILPTTKFLRYLGADPKDHIPQADTSYAKMVKGIIKRYLYYFNVPLEIWARYIFKVLPRIMMRRVVVYDRYVLDMEIGYYNENIINSRWLRKFITFICPKPKFGILLVNDPEIIWERKKEYPLELIKESMGRYQLLAERHQLHIIKTSKEPDELIRDFMNKNWRAFIMGRREGVLRLP